MKNATLFLFPKLNSAQQGFNSYAIKNGVDFMQPCFMWEVSPGAPFTNMV